MKGVPLLLVLALAAGSARADEAPAPEQPDQAADDESWNAAPPPEQASGVERGESPTPRDHARKVARALLFVPRWLVWGVAQPMRGGAYVYDHYNLPGRYQEAFYNKTRTFGVYPTAKYESGYGVTGGVRLVHHDVLGDEERIKLRGDIGGRYRFGYGVNLRSGERFGRRATVELDFGHERRPNERFFGIGNLDALSALPDMPIAPTDGAWSTRFREDKIGGIALVDVPIAGPLTARLSVGLTTRSMGGTDETDSIERAYETDMLVGWQGVTHAQTVAELAYDSRRSTNPYLSRAIDATGWYAAVHAGRTRGIGDDRSAFDTAGAEVVRYIDLHRGSRVLALRGMVETVTNDRTISFLDLPRLGGTDFLRGYPSSRFRDRALALGSAEYMWDLGNYLAAYTFVDVGRVYRSLEDVSLDVLRVGYGGGMQLHTSTSYVGRVQLAANRDGDVFLELVLSPAFPRRERVGRF
jgi:hypothetical protein